MGVLSYIKYLDEPNYLEDFIKSYTSKDTTISNINFKEQTNFTPQEKQLIEKIILELEPEIQKEFSLTNEQFESLKNDNKILIKLKN